MISAELAGNVLGMACFLVWVSCLITWIREGVSIPHYIHILALAITCVGVGCFIGLAAAQMASLTLALTLIGLPAALVYAAWFWLFGPAVIRNESALPK